MLRDRHRLEAVDVPATYWMETPPHPRERLLMPVYRIRHGRLECYLKTDFSLGYWYLSVRTPEPLRHTYGLSTPPGTGGESHAGSAAFERNGATCL
jgi:hypothetical protein